MTTTTAHEDQYAPEPDPVFETRTELEAWVSAMSFVRRRTTAGKKSAADRIRRVTLAHLHLREGEG